LVAAGKKLEYRAVVQAGLRAGDAGWREGVGRPDPKDQHLSEWISRPTSGARSKLMAGHVELVVGACGRKRLICDADSPVVCLDAACSRGRAEGASTNPDD
jgi:hypothetical protein